MKWFREVERQFVVITAPQYVALTGTTKAANSILCYGYIDMAAGLTYQTVAATMYIDGDYSIVDTAKVISMKIRADSVQIDDVIPVKNKALFKQYSYIVENIDEFYYTNPDVEECRAVSELDQFRHPNFPDDVQVMFAKDGFPPEGIWVRHTKLCGEDDGTFLLEGRMLNTPNADFGVSAGSEVLFASGIVGSEGTRICVALLPNL